MKNALITATLAASLTLTPLSTEAKKGGFRFPSRSPATKPVPAPNTIGQGVRRAATWALIGGVGGYLVAQTLSNEYLIATSDEVYQQNLDTYRAQWTLLAADHPSYQRVREIARRVLLWANQNPSDWEVAVVDEPTTMNAYCLSNKKIVVFTGLIKNTNASDQQIASIIGHEVAHVTHEHAFESIRDAAITHGIVAGAWVAMNKNTTWAHLGANLLNLSFSRGQETEADLVGSHYASRGGYRVCPDTANFWRTIASVSEGTRTTLLSSHPDPLSRASKIDSACKK